MFSVVMPCYQQEVFLTEAVESVIAQTLDRWELIIVDDGSPDLCRCARTLPACDVVATADAYLMSHLASVRVVSICRNDFPTTVFVSCVRKMVVWRMPATTAYYDR